jgi:hypothetical protein
VAGVAGDALPYAALAAAFLAAAPWARGVFRQERAVGSPG